ncbi:hypothetical protein IFM89_033680 [Coptis chinensis]|uniref:Uncharacterized protein n=1 Tax=Coptis chinensis TaxID=261450 RepID=A0A835HJ46_9MAGN|nr:hypothetical protein IFM89_033680 [Coptis chinensis]
MTVALLCALNEQAGKMLLENYEEYARYARLYTGIHALKSKPKFKTGAISESTALNIDSTKNVSQGDTKTSSNAVPVASPLAASAEQAPNKGGTSAHDQSAVGGLTTEPAVTGSIPLQKAVGGATKAQADKKKIDARKKSLKRL